MNYATLKVTFDGVNTSGKINLGGSSLIAIQTDEKWKGTSLTFLASADGFEYPIVFDENGEEVSISMAASRYIIIPPSKGIGMDMIRLTSDTNENSTITLLLK